MHRHRGILWFPEKILLLQQKLMHNSMENVTLKANN